MKPLMQRPVSSSKKKNKKKQIHMLPEMLKRHTDATKLSSV
jgi:hypothetical protein